MSMKKAVIILFAVTLTLSTFFAVYHYVYMPNEEISQKKHPMPTNTIALTNEDESGEWQKRLEWIDLIHKCDSNINWRTINYEVKLEKAKLRKNYPKNKSGEIEIGGGVLTGFWRETGSNNLAGRTHFCEYDPEFDSLYCASSGGNVWKADLNGNGWRVLNDGFKIEDIKMVRKISNLSNYRLLVSSGGWGVQAFYYSDNDGESWTASTGLAGIADWGYVVKTMVANDANQTIYLLAMEWDYDSWEKQTTLYVSTNKGVSFLKKQSWLESEYGSEEKFDIWCDRDEATCFIAVYDTLYSINNTNFSLDYIGGPEIITEGGILLSGCKTETETYLYIGSYSTDYIEFYKSTDGGLNWTAQGNIPSSPFMKNSFTVSQKFPETLYYGGVECFRSVDGGETWTKLNDWFDYYADIENKLHADIPGINSFIDAEDNEIVFINTDGGTYISDDQLQTVNNISMSNHNVGQFYSVYSHRTNDNVIFAGSQDQGYQLCTNNTGIGTSTFTQIISGDYGHIVSGNGGNSIWMVYPGFAAYYPSAISSPYDSYWWEFECSGQFWIPPLMPHPTTPGICYLGGGTTGTGTHIFEMYYAAGEIHTNELAYDFSGNTSATSISAMSYSPINNDYRYVMNGNGEFFVSTDAGLNWNLSSIFDGPDGNYLYGAAIAPSTIELGVVYIAGSGYSNPPVYKTINNGLTWTDISDGLPQTMVYEIAVSPSDNYIFAATDAGPYVYVSSHDQWYDLAQNVAPDQVFWTVDFDTVNMDLDMQTVRFGTYGRGIWDFNITSGLVNIEEKFSESLSVLPNPATDFIEVSSPSSEIKICTLYGTIAIKSKPGKINISNLSNGIYIIRDGKNSTKFVKI